MLFPSNFTLFIFSLNPISSRRLQSIKFTSWISQCVAVHFNYFLDLTNVTCTAIVQMIQSFQYFIQVKPFGSIDLTPDHGLFMCKNQTILPKSSITCAIVIGGVRHNIFGRHVSILLKYWWNQPFIQQEYSIHRLYYHGFILYISWDALVETCFR